MAAPQWSGGKCKSIQQAKAFFRHNANDRRMEAQHTNPHINTRLTHLNFSVKGLNYRERCEAYDKRMAEIDMGKPGSGKNARTVMMSVVVYPPTALLDDKPRLREWFMKAGEVAEARFGADMIDMAVDFDEIHEYRDKAGQLVTSREHGHLWLVPEVNGKLNGKQFSSRAVINGFNAELQEMSIREFGTPMMDGTGKKGGQKVEQLKAESEAREIIAQAEKQARMRTKTAQEEAQAQAQAIIAQAEEKARKKAQEADQRIADAWETIKVNADICASMLERCKGLGLTVEQQQQHDDDLALARGMQRTATEEIQQRRLPEQPSRRQREDEFAAAMGITIID